MSVTCCPAGTETDDAVHEPDCPTIDRTGELGYTDGPPEPSTGLVIRWRPGPYMQDVGGHLWRGDRGPYAHCERPECGLVYPRWDGGSCPGAGSTKEGRSMSDGMKKRDLRRALEMAELRIRELKAEVETMRKHWAPVPIPHPWYPRDPRCTLCDDTRDAPRHQVQQ